MKKIVIFLGAMALVAAMSTAAVAEKEICQQRKADIIEVSPKKDIVYTFEDCAPAKKDAAPPLSKKGM